MDFLSSVNWAELGLKALAAIVILVVTAIVAMVVKGAVAKLAQRIPALQKPGVDGAGLGGRDAAARQLAQPESEKGEARTRPGPADPGRR